MAKGLLDGGESKAIGLDDLNEGMSAEELNQEPTKEPTKEEPTPEPKAEPEVKDVVKEPEGGGEAKEEPMKAEPVKGEPAKEEPKGEESPPTTFDFAFFNKQLSTNYESLDQIKADIEKPTMESEYTDVKTQLEEWQSKFNDLNKDYELLTEQLDPSTYFSSDDAMKLEAFRKTNPDKDAAIASKVFMTGDLSSINDIDMVKMGWRFNTPNLKGTDKDLENAIAEELNQDTDTPIAEWPTSAQNRLARMASDYANQFKTLKSSVNLPEKVNLEELKSKRKQDEEQFVSELTDKWGAIAEESLKGTTEIKVPIGKPKEGEEQKFFVWTLDAAPEDTVNTLKERYIAMGVNPDENKDSFQETIDLVLKGENLPMILQKYGEDLLAGQEEKHLEETHNPNPLKDAERTDLSDVEKEKAAQTDFATEGVIPRFQTSPLFKPKI